MQLTAEEIPLGDEGTFTTVDAMRESVERAMIQPAIRETAVDLAAGLSEYDITGQIGAIRRFLSRRVKFINDPDGAEYLRNPVLMMQDMQRRGVAHGDCDDVATLGAALGRSIGIPARFRVVGFVRQGAFFEHVWAELYDGKAWRELDTTRTQRGVAGVPISRQAIIDAANGEITMLAPPPRRDSQLGFIPAVPAVVSTLGPKIAEWVGAIKPLAALFGGKESDRIRITDAMFQEAVSGNQVALLYLRQRTGNYGVITIEGHGQVGGWGSGSAKAYASQKYAEALRILGQTGPNLVDIPGVGPVGVPQGIKEAGMPVGIIAAAVAAYFLFGKRRRS